MECACGRVDCFVGLNWFTTDLGNGNYLLKNSGLPKKMDIKG